MSTTFSTQYPEIVDRKKWLILLSPRMRRFLRCQYEIAQLVHGLADSVLQEEFSDGDISFLNHGALIFIKRCSPDCMFYPLLADCIQQLFNEVPESKKNLLEWIGPQEDYSWTRPRPRSELGL